ncbi:retrotransposon protein, putative, ty1-copia subclass [Tanacetum coccineum]
MDGNVHTDKPCLVAKGFTQTYGVDYEETFSPVADIRAIRILIAIAAYYNYKIWQMDVKADFLNGHLSKEVYMVQREGFINPKYPYHACKIQRSIYGLKFNMENSKHGSIPMQEKPILSKTQGASTPAEVKHMQIVLYASAMGSIIELNWTVVKNILKYPRNTKDMFLVYCGNMTRELRVSCYTDVGYQIDANDSKPQSGYVFVSNGSVVESKSAKQGNIETSCTKAEYMAPSEASKEAVWIRKFIYRLGVVTSSNQSSLSTRSD